MQSVSYFVRVEVLERVTAKDHIEQPDIAEIAHIGYQIGPGGRVNIRAHHHIAVSFPLFELLRPAAD